MIMNVEVAIIGNSFSRSIIKPRNTLYFVTGNMTGNIARKSELYNYRKIIYNFQKFKKIMSSIRL